MSSKIAGLSRSLVLMHRGETLFFLVPLCAWGPLFAFLAGKGDVFTIALGTLMNLLLMYSGLISNTYCDYELDRGAANKKAVTEAVEFVGKERVLLLFLAETGLLIYIFYRYRHFYSNAFIDLWFWLGIFGRYAYNFKPLRLKDRGVLNMISYAVNFGVTPTLIGWSIAADSYPPGILAVVAAGFLSLSAQALWGAAVDYHTDKEAGAKTVAVVMGQRASLVLSQVFMVCSVPLMLYGMYSLVRSRHGYLPDYGFIGLLVAGLGLLYSNADRIGYVLRADRNVLRERLDNKYRQLAWLIAQTGSCVAGALIIIFLS